MGQWIQAIDAPAGTSTWLNLEKAVSIEVAVSRTAGNELFYVKAKVVEGGHELIYSLGKFKTVKDAEGFIKKLV
jgi:hypothetical protein